MKNETLEQQTFFFIYMTGGYYSIYQMHYESNFLHYHPSM